MTKIRKVTFTEDEKNDILKRALTDMARDVLGAPGMGEEWDVDISRWNGAEVEIVAIPEPEPAAVDPVQDLPETPAAEEVL